MNTLQAVTKSRNPVKNNISSNEEVQAITITFGDQAENHVGMQKVGCEVDRGYSKQDLLEIKDMLEANSCKCDLIDLNEEIQEELDAYVLIIRQGVNLLYGESIIEKLTEELTHLEWDTKAKMYGRVVNKHARYNLCFSNTKQEPNYEKGNGRIISFEEVPLLQEIRNNMSQYFGQLSTNLVAEGNLYYDPRKCGIGYHGDSERHIVIAIRLGSEIPLHYQWYLNGKPVGKNIQLSIQSGDIYIMSEKATGRDWKKKKIYTLRHAAGANKYTQIKKH